MNGREHSKRGHRKVGRKPFQRSTNEPSTLISHSAFELSRRESLLQETRWTGAVYECP